MSDLWIIVCVFCSFSLIECQTVFIVQYETNWSTAFQTCKMQSRRLPGVYISDKQKKLLDHNVTKNISCPFWIGATYDFLDINVAEPHHGYDYPYTCCEMIQNVYGNRQVNCSDCSPSYQVTCAISANKISTKVTQSGYGSWKDAFQECKRRNLTLPTRENEQFLKNVTIDTGAFWLAGIKQINFQPDLGIQNRICLHSSNGIIHEGNCSDTLMTTVCIFDNNSSGSESNTPRSPSVNTESSIKAGSSQTMTRSEPNTDNPSISTESPSKTGSLQPKTSDTGAVIGGVVGSVVVAIVITTAIVILVRKNRSRKDNKEQIEHHVREHTREKQGILNSSYEVSRNASLEKGNTKSTNLAETSTDFHTQPQKHKVTDQRSSDHGKAVENTYERVISVLYSVVQKDMKSDKAPNCGLQVKGSEDNDEEYDKTSYCSKTNQAASPGNVYDKTNFKHRDNSEYDTTDDINFKHNDNSEYDTTNEINISIDATYDHV